MKKSFIAFCAVMIFAVVSCVALHSEDTGATHIHRHAHADVIQWQCWECGMRVVSSSSPTNFGCDVSRSGQHIWKRIYASSSPVNWQCIKCGETTWTASVPSEFGCSRNKSRMHVWERQD